ncbi:SET domain protein [Aspergillus sclerotialis]|uniref:SET domain protein n=1 Tax=Aspergillus sclerotialis TaxID=2070753 RepID=A0A3A2ZP83_9EURO|nr:SET domain protein [Aspergillus sclerotialis]
MTSEKRRLSNEPEPEPEPNVRRSSPRKRVKSPSNGAEKTVMDIMAAIYFDINCVCAFRRMINSNSEDIAEDIANIHHWYRLQCDRASEFIGGAAALMLNQARPFPDNSDDRIRQILFRAGWMIFAMCAYSDAFRRACVEANEEIWDMLVENIVDNVCSIEVFARSRALDWRGPLLTLTRYNLPVLHAVLAPANRLSDEHFHHYVRTSEDKLRYPHFDGYVQTHISRCRFDSWDWPEADQVHPQTRQENDHDCDLCEQPECTCTLAPLAGYLVELFQYPIKGVGVRALANFKNGDILDEYVGELLPGGGDGDDIYALEFRVSEETYYDPVKISPKQFGNWTRFMNHSCKPSTEFHKMVVGNSVMIVVRAIRDISFGDEITVDYGEYYWQDKDYSCQCGEDNCKYSGNR